MNRPFNCDDTCEAVVIELRDSFHLTTAIETGTYHGKTTKFLAENFKQVHSVDISPECVRIAQTNLALAGISNATIHTGSSPDILRKILGDQAMGGRSILSLTQTPTTSIQPVGVAGAASTFDIPSIAKTDGNRCLFYLDAHWYNYWPIRDELQAIASFDHCRNNCLIMIDDVEVPGHPEIPYDAYRGEILNYVYLRESLENLFDDGYYLTYHIPLNPQCRGKLIAYPKSWE